MATISATTQSGVLRRSGFESSFSSRWKRGPAWQTSATGTWREASLNWLALGLLLAAWNVSSDDPASRVQPRPVALRGYSFVSVRAASLHSAEPGAAPPDWSEPFDRRR
jgi:hypothetical protein